MHAQLCPILCDSRYCSLSGTSVHGILQARILERVVFSPPGDLSNPETELVSPEMEGGFFTTEPSGNIKVVQIYKQILYASRVSIIFQIKLKNYLEKHCTSRYNLLKVLLQDKLFFLISLLFKNL